MKAQNMRVSMYFLHLELTFTPHYIITDKGLLTLVVMYTYMYHSKKAYIACKNTWIMS